MASRQSASGGLPIGDKAREAALRQVLNYFHQNRGRCQGTIVRAFESSHAAAKMTGGKIVEGYGLTETSPVTHANPLDGRRKIGSIGVPLPNTDMKVVSLEDGTTEVGVGKQGELLLKGPQVMRGYWNAPEQTAAAFTDGWFRTGDIAAVDADDYTFIVGRKKDMIIAGGYNIYPDEIDAVLVAHPAVLEAATVGIPDPKRGETVKSFVVLRPGQRTTMDELIEYCRRELAAIQGAPLLRIP